MSAVRITISTRARAKSPNRCTRSTIANRRLKIENEIWARLDSNQGPRDYESPALPLSYRPILPRLSYAVIYRQDSNFYNQTLPTPKFGHRNCVNLRESANGPISRYIYNTQFATYLRETRS